MNRITDCPMNRYYVARLPIANVTVIRRMIMAADQVCAVEVKWCTTGSLYLHKNYKR